jgi:hypothetical protein
MIRIALALIFIAFGTSAYCQMYKWVDKDGKVSYSDQPPPQGVKQQTPATMTPQARSAQGAGVVVKCQVTSPFSPKVMTVQIARGDQGRLQAQIDETISNPNVTVDECQIRENINLNATPESREFINSCELSLSHLHLVTENKDGNPFTTKLPFDLKRVRKMTIYDLQGTQDKYGGTVLMEVYGADGRLLGRVFRSVAVGVCN